MGHSPIQVYIMIVEMICFVNTNVIKISVIYPLVVLITTCSLYNFATSRIKENGKKIQLFTTTKQFTWEIFKLNCQIQCVFVCYVQLVMCKVVLIYFCWILFILKAIIRVWTVLFLYLFCGRISFKLDTKTNLSRQDG